MLLNYKFFFSGSFASTMRLLTLFKCKLKKTCISDGGGLADRAARVRAHGHRRLEGADGGRRAPRGSAGDPAGVPGVGGAPEGRVLGGSAHGELVEVRLAQDRQVGRAQVSLDRKSVV